MGNRKYYVYILTNKNNTVFYIGVTNNLFKREWEHSTGINQSFTKKYKIHKAIYYEEFNDIKDAIAREKQLKYWKRNWKLDLITKSNPSFRDLLKS